MKTGTGIIQGRLVTVQATDSSNGLALEVAEILVTAGGEGCQVSEGLRHGTVIAFTIVFNRVLMRPWLLVTV